MKSQYLYFGRKIYYSQAGVVAGSGTADLTAMTVANSGGVPPNLSYGGGDALNLQAVYRVYTAGSSKRGSSYTAANGHIGVNFHDMWTQRTNTLDTTDATSPYGTPANHVAGEVTLLLDEAWQVSSGVVTIKDNSGSGSTTAGALLTTNDTVWVNETALIASGSTPLNGVGQDLCVPAKNFIGAQALTADTGNGLTGGHSSHDGGMHWNGDAIDVTELYFKSGDSHRAADVVLLKHTAGKFKEIMQIMQSLYNGNNYDELITVHELDYNGQNVYRAFDDQGIKIYGCHITSVARS
tara:strand:+ start:784 stop:1668 length:885 start_codon:yes stop_codon:yes gene_type:complete